MPAKRTKKNATANARVSMPNMPQSYLSLHKGKFLPWSWAEKRLIQSHNYWICTARPDGRPHSAPVWGFWLDGAVWFGTGIGTRKEKNLTANPNLSLHLESGDEAVILEGAVEVVDMTHKSNAPTRKKLDVMSQRKYKMPFHVAPDAVIYRLRPRVAVAWTEKKFPYNSTRWEFK